MAKAPAFTELNELASSQLGGKVIFATDDWFTPAECIIKDSEPEWREGVFTEYGKWMDGWETRRKRTAGHDYCIIQLGIPGVIKGLLIDTHYFTGNFSPKASVQAASLDVDTPARRGKRMGSAASEEDYKTIAHLHADTWEEILPITDMGAGYANTCKNYFEVNSNQRFTHVRLNMFPDGGIARFRVYGQAIPDWKRINTTKLVELSSMLNGCYCTGYSNKHYGHPRNLVKPDRGVNMGDGWETARRMDRPAILRADKSGILQVPGREWSEFKLGTPGTIKRIDVDTNHFKGNFPNSCYIEGKTERGEWRMLLPVKKLEANRLHHYSEKDVNKIGRITHFRLTMAPDGGISRVRLFGVTGQDARL